MKDINFKEIVELAVLTPKEKIAYSKEILTECLDSRILSDEAIKIIGKSIRILNEIKPGSIYYN